MPFGHAEFSAMWFPIPLTILQLQEKNYYSYFITKLNLLRFQEPEPNRTQTMRVLSHL